MRLIASTFLACLLALAALSPAHAHRLRVFATVEQGQINGYAYFVGGARAKGASVVFREAGQRELHRTSADENGAFSWKPERPQTIRISVDAGEGHVGTLVIDQSRFSGRRAEAETETEAPQTAGGAFTAGQLETIEAAVDAAVARHTRPLMEAFEAMETRTRFNDIMGGVGMIIGVAGAAMWALSRRKGGAA
jgi:nickel transport protein